MICFNREGIKQDMNLVIILSSLMIVLSAISAQFGIRKSEFYYYKEPKVILVQLIAQDFVTLCLVIPIFIFGLILYVLDHSFGLILIAGIGGYYLYTYVSYNFYLSFNKLFFLNLSLLPLSILNFIVSFAELTTLATYFSLQKNQIIIGGIWLIIQGGLLLALWLSELIPALLKNKESKTLTQSGGKTTIQVLDLGIVVPALVTVGILLLTVTLTPLLIGLFLVLLVKTITMCFAVTMMAIFETKNGIPDKQAIVMFAIYTIGSLFVFVWILFSL